MPLQNRVDPWGKLHAVPERGILTGNRGILHNERKEVVAPWKLKAWITCSLEWKGVRRQVFSPGTWSELFFLDEATAFAAGHRPCGACRRERYREFKVAWLAANPGLVSSANPRIGEIDKIMHTERARRGGGKVTYPAAPETLPDGTMVEINDEAFLLWAGKMLKWSFGGYTVFNEIPLLSSVEVLTPASVVRAFAAGFRPQVHASAGNTAQSSS